MVRQSVCTGNIFLPKYYRLAFFPDLSLHLPIVILVPSSSSIFILSSVLCFDYNTFQLVFFISFCSNSSFFYFYWFLLCLFFVIPYMSIFSFLLYRETKLERADFALQLLMFVTEEKGGSNVYNYLSFQFLSAVVPMILS